MNGLYRKIAVGVLGLVALASIWAASLLGPHDLPLGVALIGTATACVAAIAALTPPAPPPR